MTRQLLPCALYALLLVPASAFAQTSGSVEFGVGAMSGTVDGRTQPGDVPFSNGFKPDIVFSGLNTYNDFRNRLSIPQASIEKVSAKDQYFRFEAVNSGVAFTGGAGVRNQEYLASAGRHGWYKVQFRWDEIPHVVTGTSRSLYRESSPGVWQFTGDRAVLAAARVAGTAAAYGTAVPPVVANATLDVQRLTRKTGTGSATFAISPEWDVGVSFARENQTGVRPHGMCFGNSPSCVWSEVPEKIDYATNTLEAGTEFGRKAFDVQVGYWRQDFENKVPSMIADNPFSNNVYAANVTANGQMGLYPSNDAQNLRFAGAVHRGPFHFMANVSPGWLSQNASFVPYTTNTFLLGRTGAAAPIPLPVPSLEGERHTLAMNYTASYKLAKSLEVSAKYRQYDFNNRTEEHVFNPWVNDIEAEAQLSTPGGSGQETKEYAGIGGVVDPHCAGVCNEPLSFSTKTADLGGTWFFAGRNSAVLQYWREWVNREHRDVEQTIENTFRVAVDLKPTRDLTVRVSGARQDRQPQDAEYEWFLIPGTQRPDEGFRLRNRVDLLAQYDLTDRVSVSGFYGRRTDDFNRQDPLTSMTPLGDPAKITRTGSAVPTPILGNYYVYGVLADESRSYGGDIDVLVADNVTVFAEYAREQNSLRQVSRVRSANTASQVGCPSTTLPQDCDPINDWTTSTEDVVNTYSAGIDMTLSKKIDVSVFVMRSWADGSMLTDGVNCQIGNGPNAACRTNFPNWRLDSAATPAVTFNFPNTSSRIQEANAIVRVRLSDKLAPKFRYRYQRFENYDFQTSVMNPFAFVGAAADPGGSTGLQRMIFLGADVPGYKAHVFSVTLEYRF